MQTEHHIEDPGNVEAEAPDDRVAKLHRDMAGEEPRPRPDPLVGASGYPPNCAHGMSCIADGRYDLALARLRRG